MVDIVKIILAVIPPLIWLTIFMIEDRRNPEPKGVIAKVFAAGAIGGLLYAIFIVTQIIPRFPTFGTHTVEAIWGNAFLEEGIKFVSVWILVKGKRFFDEPIDAMIYMITGAMGFAAMENLLLISYAPEAAGLMALRFFGAVLTHALVSGLLGFYWAKGRLFNGFLIAGGIHGLFNFIIYYVRGGIFVAALLLAIVAFLILNKFDIIKKYGTRNSKTRR